MDDMDPTGHNPWSCTADHVVPLSEGGEETRENIKAAHKVCNIKRSRKGNNKPKKGSKMHYRKENEDGTLGPKMHAIFTSATIVVGSATTIERASKSLPKMIEGILEICKENLEVGEHALAVERKRIQDKFRQAHKSNEGVIYEYAWTGKARGGQENETLAVCYQIKRFWD